jgi:sugar transferase (PEP-CTERM/EpsH1 system associated)
MVLVFDDKLLLFCNSGKHLGKRVSERDRVVGPVRRAAELPPSLYKMKADRNPTNFGQLPEFSSEYVDFPVRIKSRAQQRLVNWRFVLKPSDSNMRVLHFAPRVCWPLDTGAKLRNYHLARVLAERGQVTLLAFNDPNESSQELTRELLAPLENPYQQVIAVKRDAAYTFAKVVRGLWGRTPLPVLNYTTDSMKQALEGILSEKDFDVVQVESIHLMAYLPIIRAAPKQPLVVCDWHNIESELMQRYSEREPNLLRRAYAGKTARLMSAFERRAAREFDAHVVVSERDAQRLRALNPEARVFVIENGVDTAYYSDAQIETVAASRLDAPGKRRIVFVGSMDYHANIEGTVNFAREVWPQLCTRQPDLVFTIVGRNPSREVRELALTPGIEVTGTVNDVRPFYRRAIAAIVPLNVGGGSRLKILEAMAAGVPVVSTTLGAEGLNVRHGKNILIADTNKQQIEAIVSLVENEEQRKQLVDGGRALVSNHYDWSRLGANLFEIYQQLLGR